MSGSAGLGGQGPIGAAEPLIRMADGTVKQVNPLTGTQVWTVSGRGHRPTAQTATAPQALDPLQEGRYCALCPARYLETPPEKSRLVLAPECGPGSDDAWVELTELGVEHLFDTVAQFRRIPNLFEIMPYDYWHANYNFRPGPQAADHMATYLASPPGREHVLAVARARRLAAGMTAEQWAALPLDDQLAPARAFFGGGHELIVPRRHFIEGARTQDQLAGAGTMTAAEHFRFLSFTVAALADIYRTNRYIRYVAVFQNWLRAAGASFDHLHKQLVGIDERSAAVEAELARLRGNPNLYNEVGVNYAGYHNLVIAENDHAIAFAGFGHRYPTLEVYSRSTATRPWEHSPDEIRGVSDLLHACHAATGSGVASNEEWHHQPVDVTEPMPWRILLKWRVSTLAGFEGGTSIYLNTIDPWGLRDLVVPRLYQLRDAGQIAGIRIATECRCEPNSLRYLQA